MDCTGAKDVVTEVPGEYSMVKSASSRAKFCTSRNVLKVLVVVPVGTPLQYLLPLETMAVGLSS
jgi:hypothetical protein